MSSLGAINERVVLLKNKEFEFRSSDQVMLLLVVEQLQKLNESVSELKAHVKQKQEAVR